MIILLLKLMSIGNPALRADPFLICFLQLIPRVSHLLVCYSMDLKRLVSSIQETMVNKLKPFFFPLLEICFGLSLVD